MSKILTAEEIWFNNTGNKINQEEFSSMIEFAKLHVEAALKEASESIELDSKIESEYQGSLGNEEGLLYVNKEYFYIDKNPIFESLKIYLEK